MTPQQQLVLDAFMQRLPPDLVPYKNYIRAITEPMFEQQPEDYVKRFLSSTLAIEQLQVLDQQFGGLLTDQEFDEHVRKGLPVGV